MPTWNEYEKSILEKVHLLQSDCALPQLRNQFIETINSERQKMIVFLRQSKMTGSEKDQVRKNFDQFVKAQKKEFESFYPQYRIKCRSVEDVKKQPTAKNPLLEEFKQIPRGPGILLKPGV
jgi:hypothetical protein